MKFEIELSFVTCVSSTDVLNRRLLSSPCFSERRTPLVAYFNAESAAFAFNSSVEANSSCRPEQWLVWVHEDVFLPSNWDTVFKEKLQNAMELWPTLAVVGVYGMLGFGQTSRPIGCVLDRGQAIGERSCLPSTVDSLDEMLFAVRMDTGLKLDPALKFDFYATDIVLQAKEKGFQAAVVDAYCEHWSATQQSGPQPVSLAERIKTSARVFEKKWANALPITTSCFQISKPGDVAAYIDSLPTR
ncbi:MAG: hypothetical protein IPG23_17305 [Burkholderiales bacterium]|nr:hypothetical protein [Burkholderiales bacterium]